MDIRLVIHSFFLAVVLSLFVHAEGSSDEVQARVSTSSDLSIEAILEENKRQRAQIDWLQNVITRNISDLAAQINKNKEKFNIDEGALQNLADREADRKVSANEVPIGSIISWFGSFHTGVDLPSGWQLCNGSTITSGPMAGQETPDLNNAGLFVRGGPENVAGSIEDDTVRDHHHIDVGHTHEQGSHSHATNPHNHWFEQYNSRDYHSAFIGANKTSHEFCLYGHYAGETSEYRCWYANYLPKTKDDSGTTNSATSSIYSAGTGVGGVDGERDDIDVSYYETRPKNMKLVFIIRTE